MRWESTSSPPTELTCLVTICGCAELWQLAETNECAGISRKQTSWTALLKIYRLAKVIG
jgi:hypothetical protein